MGSEDERLADAWLACALDRAVGHEEHVRISFVLLFRHGREEGIRRIEDGTLRNCEALGAPERFDAALTRRWAEALADAVETSSALDADAFLREEPRFLRSDLLGAPAWKQDG